jgi:hypothetical protein
MSNRAGMEVHGYLGAMSSQFWSLKYDVRRGRPRQC